MKKCLPVSIPFSTIKSTCVIVKLHSLLLFQFHLVRLKVYGSSLFLRCFRFQFHLVRLKVEDEMTWRFASTFQFHLVRLKVVHWFKRQWMRERFQFHLVRLKAARWERCTPPSLVSIPFSTIKSESITMLGSSSFQFHLVRLKAACRRWSTPPYPVSIPFSTIKRRGKSTRICK